MNFKLHVNETKLDANANKLSASQLSVGFYEKKPRQHTDRLRCTHEPLTGEFHREYSSVNFLPYAELRRKDMKECVCKRLYEFKGFNKNGVLF